VWVKAFRFDGTPFIPKRGSSPVSFFALAPPDPGGLDVAVADVDLDGKGEIVVSGWPGSHGALKCFEADGSPVTGWNEPTPWGILAGRLILAATDRFLRP